MFNFSICRSVAYFLVASFAQVTVSLSAPVETGTNTGKAQFSIKSPLFISRRPSDTPAWPNHYADPLSAAECNRTFGPKRLIIAQSGGLYSVSITYSPYAFLVCHAGSGCACPDGCASGAISQDPDNGGPTFNIVWGFTFAPNNGGVYECTIHVGDGDIPTIRLGILPSISGFVSCGGNAVAGATLTLSGPSSGTTISTFLGKYFFNGLVAGGNYSVSVSAPGCSFPTPTKTFPNLTTGQGFEFSGTPVSGVDLRVTKIEPVQVVYGLDVPLVKGKGTRVRVTVGVDDRAALMADQTIQSIDLRINFEGASYDTSFLKEEFDVNGIYTNVVDSFVVPQAIASNMITVSVDPKLKITESNENNNSLIKGVVIQESRPLTIAFMRVTGCSLLGTICYGPLAEFDRTVEGSSNFIQSTYPLADTGFTKLVPAGEFKGNPIFINGLVTDLLELGIISYLVDDADKTIGIVPADYFSFHFSSVLHGATFTGGRAALVQEDYAASTAAHELGHMLGISEEEYETNPPQGNRASGFNVINNEPRPKFPQDDVHCFMGSGSQNVTRLDWIDNFHYKYLLTALEKPSSLGSQKENSSMLGSAKLSNWMLAKTEISPSWMLANIEQNSFNVSTVSSSSFLVIGGIIGKDDTLQQTKIYLKSGSIPVEPIVTDSQYSVRVLDRNRTQIAEANVNVSYLLHVEPGAGIDVEQAPFLAAVPFPINAFEVQIKRGNQTIAYFPLVGSLLRTAINSIPESGFYQNGSQRREALLNKLAAIENQIENGNFNGARQKLKNDLSKHVEDWVRDNYSIQTSLQLTKSQILALIDETIARLSVS